jgi:hypothetical protein
LAKAAEAVEATIAGEGKLDAHKLRADVAFNFGGEMIRRVTVEETSWNDLPLQVRGRDAADSARRSHPPAARSSCSRAACRGVAAVVEEHKSGPGVPGPELERGAHLRP